MIKERGKVIIIPDEKKILQEEYKEDINGSHTEAYQHFSDKFQLGHQFALTEYQETPLIIARDGHLTVKTVEETGLFILYIPRVVTDRQIDWLYKNMDKIKKYSTIGGYAISKEEPIIIEGFDSIIKIANKRNMIQDRKEEEENVRKEI